MFIVRGFWRHLPTEHDGFHGADGTSQALQHGDVRIRSQQVRNSMFHMMTKSTSQGFLLFRQYCTPGRNRHQINFDFYSVYY